MSQADMTGAELRAWRESHAIPRRMLAEAVGYRDLSAITRIELYGKQVPQRVQAHMATATQPPCLTGVALRTWRHRHGLTTRQLATRLGYAQSAVKMWETNHRKVPWGVRLYVAAHPIAVGSMPDEP